MSSMVEINDDKKVCTYNDINPTLGILFFDSVHEREELKFRRMTQVYLTRRYGSLNVLVASRFENSMYLWKPGMFMNL